MTPTWFITGASSGLGKQIALEALSRGHKVVAVARSQPALEPLAKLGAHTYSLDVTAPYPEIQKAVSSFVESHGPITHVINAAGYGLDLLFEESTPEEVSAQFDTNIYGTVNVTRAILPHLREQRSGVVAMFGSLGSWSGICGMPFYAATKWAASALALSLRDEVECFGISVTSIEPGYFRTEFLNPSRRQARKGIQIPEYDGTPARGTHDMLNSVDNKQPGDPVKGARVMVDVLTGTGVGKGKKIPPRLILGSDIVAGIKGHLAETQKMLDEWEEIALSTDHDDTKN